MIRVDASSQQTGTARADRKPGARCSGLAARTGGPGAMLMTRVVGETGLWPVGGCVNYSDSAGGPMAKGRAYGRREIPRVATMIAATAFARSTIGASVIAVDGVATGAD